MRDGVAVGVEIGNDVGRVEDVGVGNGERVAVDVGEALTEGLEFGRGEEFGEIVGKAVGVGVGVALL